MHFASHKDLGFWTHFLCNLFDVIFISSWKRFSCLDSRKLSPRRDDWCEEILRKNPIFEIARQSSDDRDEYFLNICPMLSLDEKFFFSFPFLLCCWRKSLSRRKSKDRLYSVRFEWICSFQFFILSTRVIIWLHSDRDYPVYIVRQKITNNANCWYNGELTCLQIVWMFPPYQYRKWFQSYFYLRDLFMNFYINIGARDIIFVVCIFKNMHFVIKIIFDKA